MESDKEAPSQADLQAKYDSIIEEASQVANEIQMIKARTTEIPLFIPDIEKELEEIPGEHHDGDIKYDPDNPIRPDEHLNEDVIERMKSGLYTTKDFEHEANKQLRELEEQLSEPRSRFKKLKEQFQEVMLQAMRHNISLYKDPFKEVLLELTETGSADPKPVSPAPQSVEGEFIHSPDYRTVRLNGQDYKLTSRQAQVIEILHELHKLNYPGIGSAYILERIDATPQTRWIDLFKNNKDAYRALIVRIEGKRDLYRLNL